MEDTDYGENCTLVIDSFKIILPVGATSNGASLPLPCGERFGGVDSIRRINKNRVEVLMWRIQRG